MPKGVYDHKNCPGLFKKGCVPWTKGRTLSDEHRANIGKGNLGRQHTEEEKAKMCIAQKLRFQKTPVWNKGKKMSPEAIENNRKAQTGRKQTIETRLKRSRKWLKENNPNYIDGRTRLGCRHPQDMKLAIWRESVFVRDDYTCQVCFVRGGYLEAHHIKSWSKYPELRYELSNGQTLCKKCHKLTNNYAGKKEYNTPLINLEIVESEI
jgi:hypothetical protein